MSFFAVENLGVRFGGVVAVDGVSFEVKQGEVYTIIGPNGAGKTTIFNLIGLIYPPTSGRILFEDREVTGCAAPRRGARHRAHVPEHRAVRARHRAAEPADRPPPPSPHQSARQELLFLPRVRRAEIAQREAVEQRDRPARSRALPRQPGRRPALRRAQGDRARPRARHRAEAAAARRAVLRASIRTRPTTWRSGSRTSRRSSASRC